MTGVGSATDTHCVHERKDPLVLDAVRLGAEKAYKMAGLTPKDISFAELHDPFIILELAISEELGFFKRGKAKEAVAGGETRIDGRLPINTSGGLKAKGHPVGATGAAQVYEIVHQLRGECGPRQVEGAKIGMTDTMGGSFASIAHTIMRRAW